MIIPAGIIPRGLQIAAQRPTAFNQAIEDEMQAEQPPPWVSGVLDRWTTRSHAEDMGLMNVGASIFNVEDSGEEPVLFALRAAQTSPTR